MSGGCRFWEPLGHLFLGPKAAQEDPSRPPEEPPRLPKPPQRPPEDPLKAPEAPKSARHAGNLLAGNLAKTSLV